MGGWHGGRRAGLQPANLKGALALCIGSEGEGLAHLTEQKCVLWWDPAKGPNGIAQRILCGVGADHEVVLRQRNG